MPRIEPQRLAAAGGLLIGLSGVLNTALGLSIGAWFYEVYPGGWMGHVGIVAGLIAVVLGTVLWRVIAPLHASPRAGVRAVAALLTIVLGHAGAIAGAIYVGTLGVVLCYAAGVWTLVAVGGALLLGTARRPG